MEGSEKEEVDLLYEAHIWSSEEHRSQLMPLRPGRVSNSFGSNFILDGYVHVISLVLAAGMDVDHAGGPSHVLLKACNCSSHYTVGWRQSSSCNDGRAHGQAKHYRLERG